MTSPALVGLHPALQYHLVNSLGWPSLRAVQEAAIGPILAGRDCLILAPTAGGKTEAAAIPVLSRMLTEDWRGLSVLYVCPIKALLNNLEPRLARYLQLVGRSVALWHGDVAATRKNRIRRELPDVLLTTPESLEGLLISRSSDRKAFLGQVRVIIVDELHAFAGDDRGWHLRAVLHRVSRYAAVRPQRVGLSATVGNPEELLGWFSGMDDATVVGEAAPPKGGELMIDAVGSLEGAATVLSRLYRGDKRLVFCDSRSKVERLANLLRQMDVQTFVSHSSLSASERRAAESAFSEARDCVIVATSTLELGIDVGDLDRVLQIDAPSTVASLLQRMGRTGRRPGMPRNCTFLTTSDEALLLAAALCTLLLAGYTEPIRPPGEPWHLVAQQAMALTLEGTQPTLSECVRELGRLFPELPSDGINHVVEHMLGIEVLWEDQGILGFGRHGEATFGRRNFLELVSSFTTPPLFAVLHGTEELGYVDPVSFQSDETPAVISLGGHNWTVESVDWKRRAAHVQPATSSGRSQWIGSSRALSGRVTNAVRSVLLQGASGCTLSRRASTLLDALREQYSFLAEGQTTNRADDQGPITWWTFAGMRANALIARAIAEMLGSSPKYSDLAIVSSGLTTPDLLHDLVLESPGKPNSAETQFASNIKFHACLPQDAAIKCVWKRMYDPEGARNALAETVR